MSDFHLVLDASAVEDLAGDDEAVDLIQSAGDEIADRGAEQAPKESGAGADSIHCEVHTDADPAAFASTFSVPDNTAIGYVSWDQDHFYMLFAEVGTEDQPATPFLRPALDSTSI